MSRITSDDETASYTAKSENVSEDLDVELDDEEFDDTQFDEAGAGKPRQKSKVEELQDKLNLSAIYGAGDNTKAVKKVEPRKLITNMSLSELIEEALAVLKKDVTPSTLATTVESDNESEITEEEDDQPKVESLGVSEAAPKKGNTKLVVIKDEVQSVPQSNLPPAMPLANLPPALPPLPPSTATDSLKQGEERLPSLPQSVPPSPPKITPSQEFQTPVVSPLALAPKEAATQSRESLPPLPPPSPQVSAPKTDGSEVSSQIILDDEDDVPPPTRKTGISPLMNMQDDPAYIDLSDRIREFYQRIDPSKLTTGVGQIVEWTIKHSEEELNIRLMKKYGEDLNTAVVDDFEEEEKKEKEAEKRMSVKDIETEQKVKKLMQTTSFIAWDKQKQTTRADTWKSFALNLQEKEKLVALLKRHEPNRIEKCVYVMVKYAKKHGVDALNQQLVIKYGEHIDTGVIEKSELDRKGAELLSYYFSKYDPRMLERGGIEQVKRWVRRNGLKAMNLKLEDEYGESLEQFGRRARELFIDLRKFYKLVDKKKTKEGIEQVATWGLVNGIPALNNNLERKYGKDLTALKGAGHMSTKARPTETPI